MTEAELLRKAAEIIERNGLAVGRLICEDGHFDVIASLRVAAGGAPHMAPPGSKFKGYTNAIQLLMDHLPEGTPSVANWSDKDKVAAVLREVADKIQPLVVQG